MAGCHRNSIIPDGMQAPGERVYTGCIPETTDELPKLYIEYPKAIDSKEEWTENCSVTITATVDGETRTVYSSEGVKVKGHGNSTWEAYPKKPYALKLPEQANFNGTGPTKRWVLLANWMDRTLLRNQVAFEAARRTSLEWTPSGIFVELYMKGTNDSWNRRGCYWLGEKIHVEGSHFSCDYLYSYDTSDPAEHDFESLYGHWKQHTENGGIPIELKYPDRDNYSAEEFTEILHAAETALHQREEALMRGDKPGSVLDLESFADWYLVNELACNGEPQFPKSCFLYLKNGRLYAGPVWDFDWGTFVPGIRTLTLKSTLYYYQIWTHPEFRSTLKRRWKILKPQFESLGSYIDRQAALIGKSEAYNRSIWPCYPNPLSEGENGLVNGDELMSFPEAVSRMKEALAERIKYMDFEINALQ